MSTDFDIKAQNTVIRNTGNLANQFYTLEFMVYCSHQTFCASEILEIFQEFNFLRRVFIRKSRKNLLY